MRSSVKKDDPGYKNFAYGKYEILLDGKFVPLCITADEEEGFVLVYVADKNGRPMINATKDGTVQSVLRGKVEIIEKQLGFAGESVHQTKVMLNGMTAKERQEVYEHLYNLGCRKF